MLVAVDPHYPCDLSEGIVMISFHHHCHVNVQVIRNMCKDMFVSTLFQSIWVMSLQIVHYFLFICSIDWIGVELTPTLAYIHVLHVYFIFI
jgi:hypothetical protein